MLHLSQGCKKQTNKQTKKKKKKTPPKKNVSAEKLGTLMSLGTSLEKACDEQCKLNLVICISRKTTLSSIIKRGQKCQEQVNDNGSDAKF